MGVICYAFLFGRPPFETNEVKLTYKKIKSCEYTFPVHADLYQTTSAPEEAKDFIKNILILDPKKRLTTK
jgi:polo-like kinase 1